MKKEDPFDFLLKVSEISRPQMDLLRTCAFAGEPVNAIEKAPPEDQADLLLISMPETQHHAGKVAAGVSGTQEQDDVFLTPPEKSSAPSSGDMPPSQPCKLNHEALGFVDLDDSQGNGCVHLGRDSELGLPQGVEGESVAQSPRGIKRGAVAEEFEGFEREACLSELSVKKSKLAEPNLGLGIDVEPEKADVSEEQVYKENEISVQKNLGSCHGNEASVKEQGQKKNSKFVFQVLRFLAENLAHDDEEEEEDDANLEDVVNIGGIDFPRPRWWDR